MSRIKKLLLSLVFIVNGILLVLSYYLGTKTDKFRPCSEFFNVQYVAHARYAIDTLADNSKELYEVLVKDLKYKIIETDILFTKDSIPVLCHEYNIAQIAKNDEGLSVNKNIDELQFSELSNLYFTKPESVIDLNGGWKCQRIMKLDDLLIFAKRNNICIQLDMQKHSFGSRLCERLYNMVSEHGMLYRVIWETSEGDFWNLVKLDRNLIYQLDETWSMESIEACKKRQMFSSLIILSKWFPDYSNLDYSSFIKTAHKNGYLVKCSIINDSIVADSLLKMGVDLIVTDFIRNPL